MDTFSRISIFQIVLFVGIAHSCSQHLDNELTKIEALEHIQLIETFNIPPPDSLILKDELGNIITKDSMMTMKDFSGYFIDYYKNSEGVIKQGILREKTEQDENLMNRVFEVNLNEDEINEIQNLSSSELKEKYLINLWDSDQDLRKESPQHTAGKFGWNSEEHKLHRARFIKADNLIFKKMKLFLETHGYPEDTNNFHWKAKNAFPIIIGHHQTFNHQEEVLKYMITAYENGHCDLSELIWILGEMHEAKFRGQRYKIGNASDEEAYQTFLKVLDIKIVR